jgi:hypothetical protein
LVYMFYDVIWDSFYANCLSQISSSLVPRSFSVVWVTANWEGVAVRWVLLAIPLIVLTLKVPSSKVQLRGVFLVFIIDLAMVYWLNSTGFFQRFYFFWVFLNTPGFHGPPDPEGWVWFIGKLTSFLVAPLMVLDYRRLHKHKAEKNKKSEFSQEILKEEVS